MKKLLLFATLIPCLASASSWECINRNATMSCNTWRMSVPGGWVITTDNNDKDIAAAFVPDPSHFWKI